MAQKTATRKKAEENIGAKFEVSVLVSAPGTKIMRKTQEDLRGMGLEEYGIDIDMPSDSSASTEKGSTLFFELEDFTRERVDALTELLSDIDTQLGDEVGIEVSATETEIREQKEEEEKADKKK